MALTLEAGHGHLSTGRVDAAIQPWQEGKPLAEVFGGAAPRLLSEGVAGGSLGATITWGEAEFEVFESSLPNAEDVVCALS